MVIEFLAMPWKLEKCSEKKGLGSLRFIGFLNHMNRKYTRIIYEYTCKTKNYNIWIFSSMSWIKEDGVDVFISMEWIHFEGFMEDWHSVSM